MRRILTAWLVWLLVAPAALQAATVVHRLDLSDAARQQIRVHTSVSDFPPGAAEPMVWVMPVWTPGSYLVREFARNLEQIRAEDDRGRPLRLVKLDKHRWQVERPATGGVHLHYRIHAGELSVRTSWLDPDFTLINATATLLYPESGQAWPQEVWLHLPEGWAGSHADLESPGPHRYRAADYDTLVDNPVVAGRQWALSTFEVEGVPLRLVSTGDLKYWDNAAAAGALQQLAAAHVRFWGELPFGHYSFINLLVEKGGGLEHDNNTVIMASRFAQRDRKRWLRWLELASHELFHAWNVRRMRPAGLTRYDLTTENYTRELWFAEGFTSYYQSLLVHRAGLSTEEELLRRLARRIQRAEQTPGRHVQSLEAASFDAWIKFYRPDPQSRNSRVSYYTRGAVVALLLDARLRKQGRISLDRFMQAAWQRFRDNGYRNADLYDLLEEMAGPSMARWLQERVEGTGPLDYAVLRTSLGLELVRRPEAVQPPELPAAWLDLHFEDDSMIVSRVPDDSSLRSAGLLPGDEVIALDGYRLQRSDWQERLKTYRPGERVPLLVARRGALRSLDVQLEAVPLKKWKLRPAEKRSRGQTRRYRRWLAGKP